MTCGDTIGDTTRPKLSVLEFFMKINYAISLWNFTHTSNPLPLPSVLNAVKEQGFGIELWSSYPGIPDLFSIPK